MKYMLLTYLDEKAWANLSPEDQKQAMAECAPHVESLAARGKLIAGAPLNYTSTASTVRVRGGKRIITDGPFAETHEQLGGYTVIEADDMAEAVAIAASFFGGHHSNEWVSIEVRPIVDLSKQTA